MSPRWRLAFADARNPSGFAPGDERSSTSRQIGTGVFPREQRFLAISTIVFLRDGRL
jgi:hypothetical protein